MMILTPEQFLLITVVSGLFTIILLGLLFALFTYKIWPLFKRNSKQTNSKTEYSFVEPGKKRPQGTGFYTSGPWTTDTSNDHMCFHQALVNTPWMMAEYHYLAASNAIHNNHHNMMMMNENSGMGMGGENNNGIGMHGDDNNAMMMAAF